MSQIDQTHAPSLRSWVASANGHTDFPIQNLPFGSFTPLGRPSRGGIAIGDQILDLAALAASGLLQGEAQSAAVAGSSSTLNPLLALGAGPRRALRRAVSALLAEGAPVRPELLHKAADCTMNLPAQVGDYTDFYAGIHHATNVGKLFRPDNPLLPNYKYVPIGYHGRASSLRPSGGEVKRPLGQRKPPEGAPVLGASARLDYEMELGIWVGPGNALGEPVAIDQAAAHIAGYAVFNDWSARDLQAWEYQPLGPFLAKSFHSTVSAWIVTPEALAPFRAVQAPRPEGDPQPLPYLWSEADQQEGALALDLEVLIATAKMREAGLAPHRLSLGSALNMYWTPAQLLAHHTINGCNLAPGDLLGTGTISSPEREGVGSLLELSDGGKTPISLPNGETRTFLENGDEVLMRVRAHRDGFAPIGFGECRGTIMG